ncbi:hypothetical protein GE09DRAFT_1294003 [Coniochaeta sp. 2T2.1]|nr:hypothetical protein GE09DRAFT_1294003 [Coniochaeta sp. 2T2.1]
MTEPTYVVLPVPADGAKRTGQDNAKIASAIQQTLRDNTHPKEPEEEPTGPLKEILAYQDSLYKYISWEDPIRTLCSYIGSLSILLGAHYLPLTQLAVKAGAITLGGTSVSHLHDLCGRTYNDFDLLVVTVTEFASRSFGSNAFLARLRPNEYKKVPESTLNATLKDIHDLIQYSVEQTQRVVFGQDLHKTFAASLGFTALYWSIKVLSPFSLAVLILTSLFIAPLVASPRGDKGKALAEDGRTKVADQSSKVREAASDTGRHIGDMTHSGKQTAADLSTHAKETTVNLPTQAKGTAVDLSDVAAETFKTPTGKDL